MCCLHKTIRRLSVCLFLTTLLAGCGQKGDLYHPEEEEAAISPTRLIA